MGVPVWRSKDGKVMPIQEMDDNHLIGALTMLRTHGTTNRREAIHAIQVMFGEGPEQQDYVREQIEEIETDTSWRDYLPEHWKHKVKFLEEEARRRMLLPARWMDDVPKLPPPRADVET